GVEYGLEPWPDHHVMRVVQHYDEASEKARLAEHQARLRRETQRKSANAMALLTGQLPAVVQNAMADELGLLPARITIVSLLGSFALLAACILWIVSYTMRQLPPPLPLILLAAYLGVENSLRFLIVWTQGR